MTAVAVVTDSTPYLPPHLIERWGIRQVSLYVGWNGDLRPEHEYDDLDAFYVRLKESPELPVTSQPSVGDFLAVYEPLAEAGHDIVSVHIASGLSGTYESGREAAQGRSPRSRARAWRSSTGRPARAGWAAWSWRRPAPPRRAPTSTPSWRPCARARETLDIWFCLDTLEYLRRGGRIGAAQALLARRCRSSRSSRSAPRSSRSAGCARGGAGSSGWSPTSRSCATAAPTDWVVQHAQGYEDAERLVAEGKALLGSEPLFCTQVGPVLGTHLGSGMLVGGMTVAQP